MLKIYQENFSTQKEILLQKNIEYQKQEESTDDVTIVGLKIEPIIEVDAQTDLCLHINKV